MNHEYKDWKVSQTVELGASAEDVWQVVGGFFSIHKWHPDIKKTEILDSQADILEIRRLLTFPGQPKTTEQLIMMDNEDFHYTYKWHSGAWGEEVKDYRASLRVFNSNMGENCFVQWASTFRNPEDAVSEFYWNGFRNLQQMFPLLPMKS